ncbi:MAG: hypothetical protein ABIQ98_01520 [Sphingomicrobium sp.]
MGLSRHWADQAAELFGAASLGAGAGFSVWWIAPVVDLAAFPTTSAAVLAGTTIGWALVRLAPGATITPLPVSFEQVSIEVGDGAAQARDAASLDREAPADLEESRVVRLFEPRATPTAGELQTRIEAHLGHSAQDSGRPPAPWDGPSTIPDASDALHAALDDLRRSLRS